MSGQLPKSYDFDNYAMSVRLRGHGFGRFLARLAELVLHRTHPHARQERASPSGDRADALNATANNRFPQAGQIFVWIIARVSVRPTRMRQQTCVNQTGDSRSYRACTGFVERRLSETR